MTPGLCGHPRHASSCFAAAQDHHLAAPPLLAPGPPVRTGQLGQFAHWREARSVCHDRPGCLSLRHLAVIHIALRQAGPARSRSSAPSRSPTCPVLSMSSTVSNRTSRSPRSRYSAVHGRAQCKARCIHIGAHGFDCAYPIDERARLARHSIDRHVAFRAIRKAAILPPTGRR
jgi:hypothetical protein